MQRVFKKYSHYYKAIAVLWGLFLLSVTLFSAFYIATETQHDCSGDGCVICSCTQVCERIIRQAGGNVAAEIIFDFALSGFLSAILFYNDKFFKMTLVAQKVRLND